MTKHYNPNDYVFLCQSDEGFVLAQNTISDIITSVQQPDKVLGYTKDFNEICKLFIECIDIRVKGKYSIGDKVSYNRCQYYVLEIGNTIKDELQELIIGKQCTGDKMKYWIKYRYKNLNGDWIDDDCFALNIKDLMEKRMDIKLKYRDAGVIIELIVVL